MLGKDLQPSRIEVAKQAAINFVDILSDNDVGSKISIVTFSGSALSEGGFSSEYFKVKDLIKDIEISDIPGTAIGEAIVLSSNLLSVENMDDEETLGSIILITDGQSNVGIDVNSAIEYANQRHIVVNTIGVGTKSGAKFGNSKSLLVLDEAELKKISDSTGGRYFYVNDQESFDKALESIALESSGKVSVSLAPFFYLAILLLTFMEWFFTITRYRIVP